MARYDGQTPQRTRAAKRVGPAAKPVIPEAKLVIPEAKLVNQ
jgi:hypothetical protein